MQATEADTNPGRSLIRLSCVEQRPKDLCSVSGTSLGRTSNFYIQSVVALLP